MIKIFAEYMVAPEKVDDVKSNKETLRLKLEQLGARNFKLFYGPDQPGLIVEDFEVDSMEQYETIKSIRKSSGEFHSLTGEPAKLSLWAFVEM